MPHRLLFAVALLKVFMSGSDTGRWNHLITIYAVSRVQYWKRPVSSTHADTYLHVPLIWAT